MKICFEFPKKKRYNTQKDAERAILLIDNQNISAYNCDSCKGWHLTSATYFKK